jgi:DNA-directed RNA polymerase specialized sigma24 family protein
VARCHAGDGAAWHEVVERYQRLVFSVAHGGGLDVEDAADVTHSTFTALPAAITRWCSDDRLAPWLVTTARRTTWQIRMRQAAPGGTDDHDWDRVAALHEGLALLATSCRELLTSLYLDPAEIGDVAVGSTRADRARCLERLRALTEAQR